MRLRLIHTETLSNRGIQSGFLASCCFLLVFVVGELVLKNGRGPSTIYFLAAGALVAFGMLLGLKLYTPPRQKLFWRSVALALLPPIAWLLGTWHLGKSIGAYATAGLAVCVLLVMISVFRAPATWYAGLASLTFLCFWLFTGDPILSGQWVGGLVAVLLTLHLVTQHLLSRERAKPPVEPRRLRLAQSQVLSAGAARAGFGMCCCFLLMIFAGDLALEHHAPVTTTLVMKLLGLSALGICLGMARYPSPRAGLFWKGIATVAFASIAWLLWTFWVGSSIGLARTIAFAVCILFVMVAIFRAPPLWYAALTLLLTSIVAILTHSVVTTLLMALALGGLLVLLNYGVQLVLDHEREIRLLTLKDAPSFEIAGKSAFVLLLPVLLLVAFGSAMNYYFQSWLIRTPYAEAVWLGDNVPIVHSHCREGPEGIAELERDLDCSISRWESGLKAQTDTYVNEASGDVKRLSNQAPDAVAKQVMALRPPTIEDQTACSGFQKSYDLFRASITVSFTSPCRTLIEHVNEALTRSHAKMAKAINDSVGAANADVNTVVTAHTDRFRQDVSNEIHRSAERARETNRQLFIALRILQVISWVLLSVSVVAAYQMLLGRVVFDRKTANGVTFRLAKPHQLVKPLSMTLHHMLDLHADLPKQTRRKGNATRWFVSLKVSRWGEDASMNAALSCAGTAPLQRMLAGNYVTTAIDIVPIPFTIENGSIPKLNSNGPKLSVAGDHRLVRIELKPGQKVGFRIADLVAWTDRVELISRYTTHIGASLLKLGSFCIVAEGAQPDEGVLGSGEFGYIVLRSEGELVSVSDEGTSTPVSNLLAWDESQEFALAQRLHPWKVWINEPSVVTRSVAGAVLLDEGSPGQWPLLGRIGNLFRYFLLPI
ncbi:MAG: hypothetical protein SGJ19_26725 [Planctomycetia bacterium]|nr:hypothetical protein [Planctomycetia bacterium]